MAYFPFKCFRVIMPPPPKLHSTPAAKECHMSNFKVVSQSSLFSITNGNSKGGISKDVLHAVADPDIQIGV